MKATIVIPNINGKGWLKDSIESVYAQTEQDFELIIVDNGSTDESLEQARSYCGRPNFTLIENGTNTGFSHAVNQGIARAKGEYVVMFIQIMGEACLSILLFALLYKGPQSGMGPVGSMGPSPRRVAGFGLSVRHAASAYV